jgi:hypothetical protein
MGGLAHHGEGLENFNSFAVEAFSPRWKIAIKNLKRF